MDVPDVIQRCAVLLLIDNVGTNQMTESQMNKVREIWTTYRTPEIRGEIVLFLAGLSVDDLETVMMGEESEQDKILEGHSNVEVFCNYLYHFMQYTPEPVSAL